MNSNFNRIPVEKLNDITCNKVFELIQESKVFPANIKNNIVGILNVYSTETFISNFFITIWR
jgi:hypothetical protein